VKKRLPETLFTYPEQAIAFGRHFREVRKEQGMSQQELALEASVERSTIVRIESAKMNASLDMIMVLAKALKVHPKRLFEY
jgi:DNA-binding XRE family transcriptional regulator